MDQQAKVAERDGVPEATTHGLAGDVSAFTSDVLTLTELQSRLPVADVRECNRRDLIPALVLLCGMMLGMASFPIALVTLAFGLVQYQDKSHFMAFLIVVGVGAIGSALLCIVGWIKVRQCTAVLGRSRGELVRNLRWIKRVLARNRLK